MQVATKKRLKNTTYGLKQWRLRIKIGFYFDMQIRPNFLHIHKAGDFIANSSPIITSANQLEKLSLYYCLQRMSHALSYL